MKVSNDVSPHLDGVDNHPKQRYGGTNAPIALENISMMMILMMIMILMMMKMPTAI